MTASERRQEVLKSLFIGMEPTCEKEAQEREKTERSDAPERRRNADIRSELEKKFDELYGNWCDPGGAV
ncbi:MAG: hypothetical protein LUH42_03900 [Oscillospiraceae bacterium]|nr:hypothetical protein [Oscillospiraceae bacterium]